MNRSDWFLSALNAFLIAWAFIGFASNDEDTLMVGAMLTMAVAAVNMVVLYRRRERRPERTPKAKARDVDEMDVHTVLDLDARVDALERAQSDAVDAARWRALVDSGQVTAPAADRLDVVSDGTGARSQSR